jgi:hypothetical protein
MAGTNGNDFQQNKIVYILNSKDQMANPRGIWINKKNILAVSVYFSIRHCIEPTWLNDRDRFFTRMTVIKRILNFKITVWHLLCFMDRTALPASTTKTTGYHSPKKKLTRRKSLNQTL